MLPACKREQKTPPAAPPIDPTAAALAPRDAAPPPPPIDAGPPPTIADMFATGTGKGKLRLGASKRQGPLDMQVVLDALSAELGYFEGCYERGLSERPGLKGNVQLAFKIGPDGVVTQSLAQGLGHEATERCMAALVEHITFPAAATPTTAFVPVLVGPRK